MEYSDNDALSFWILEIADLKYNFNPKHKILRVLHGGKFYDIKCDPGIYVPNKDAHLALAMLPDSYFEETLAVDKEHLDIPPGLFDMSGRLELLPKGICFLIPKNQHLSTTNPQNGHAGFAISNLNTFDMDNVTIAISPPLPGKDYTTLEDKTTGDLNNQSIGIFINKQGSIIIKGLSSSITMGSEGMHFGGKIISESSVKDTGVLSENPFSKIIASTIPTAWSNFPIPNIGAIASIANGAAKFAEIVDKSGKIGKVASDISNIIGAV